MNLLLSRSIQRAAGSLLLVASFGYGVQAQYHPMVIDNANWVVLAIPDCASAGKIYSIQGDTIIADTQYYKVYQRTYYRPHCGNSPYFVEFEPPYNAGAPRIFALIREDTLEQTVWAKMCQDADRQYSTSPGNDTLLYDFRLGVGDTLRSFVTDFWPFRVEKIDTVNLYGKFRRRFMDSEYADEIIEGLGGAAYGPFDLQTLLLNDGVYRLLDYCIGSLEDCGITEENPSAAFHHDLQSLSIYPTYAESTIGLNLSSGSPAISRIEILSTNGSSAYQQVDDFRGVYPVEIPVGHLPTGFYVLRVTFLNGDIAIGKFLKK